MILCVPILGCPAVLLIVAGLWVWRRRTGRDILLSSGTLGDKIAWLSFNLGVMVMFGVALFSLLSEGDGDFRGWAQIRLHTRILLTAAFVAAAVPLHVATWQFLNRGKTKRMSPSRNDPLANGDNHST
jgi:hypothetical protein